MIVRVNKTDNYSVMSNFHLRDNNLSLKAKGLMCVILSLPDEWEYSIAGLAAINKENETAIKSALKELKDAGYLVVTKLKPNETSTGRIEYIYNFFEIPNNTENEKQGTKKQGIEILPLEILPIENQGQLNTNILNTNILNKEERTIKDEQHFSDALKIALDDFKEMRKKIRKPLTDRALQMILKKVKELSGGDEEKAIEILNQSTENSWQGVYPLKEIKQPSVSPNTNTQYKSNEGIDWNAIFAEARKKDEERGGVYEI